MAFDPCKNCGHDIGCGCEYRLVDGIECCDFCYATINKIEEKKIIIEDEQSISEVFIGTSAETTDRESEIL